MKKKLKSFLHNNSYDLGYLLSLILTIFVLTQSRNLIFSVQVDNTIIYTIFCLMCIFFIAATYLSKEDELPRSRVLLFIFKLIFPSKFKK